MRSKRVRPAAVLPFLTSVALACGDGGGGETGSGGAEAEEIARGKHYYKNVCVACHNGDPNVDGTLGPALASTPLEVIEAKVMRREYPAGYTPKRESRSMPEFPFLEPELPAIAAYLASVNSGS